MGIEEDGKQILIPTVVDGKIVSNAEAIKHYHDTGENLGKFDTVANANQYSQDLHRAQQDFYKSGGAPPDEAVDTGKKPLVPVPDTPLVTPKDSRVTPTKVPEPVIPDRLTKPVEPEVRKADQKDLPDVAPVTPRSVDSDYDLTPRKFDEPQPDPSTFFAQYNRTNAAYPTKNTAVRKALVTMYNQANAAYKNADQAWSQRKAEFETEEGKRLSSENERAGRGQTIENTTASEQHGIDMEKRKEVLDFEREGAGAAGQARRRASRSAGRSQQGRGQPHRQAERGRPRGGARRRRGGAEAAGQDRRRPRRAEARERQAGAGSGHKAEPGRGSGERQAGGRRRQAPAEDRRRLPDA